MYQRILLYDEPAHIKRTYDDKVFLADLGNWVVGALLEADLISESVYGQDEHIRTDRCCNSGEAPALLGLGVFHTTNVYLIRLAVEVLFCLEPTSHSLILSPSLIAYKSF